jgi:MFS family permease
LYAAFTAPYVIQRDGLPTGDAQKTVFWAQQVKKTQSLPDYSRSLTLLNRDPVDFYTPGLHTTTAQLFSTGAWSLPSIGLFAIVASIATAAIAAAIGKDIFDTPGKIFPATLIILLTVSNLRFLRYLREPGYHLQNIMGEFFLWGLVYLVISLIHRWRNRDVALMLITLLALILTHQFSAFIGFFVLIPALIVFLVTRRHALINALRSNLSLSLLVAITILILIGGAFVLGLQEKIPHLFTDTPHLVNELPTLLDYPRLLGSWFLLIGLFGTTLLVVHTAKKHPHYRESAVLCAAIIVILLLSQGPRLFIDIPPVRALLYLCIPLTIAAAYGIAMVSRYISLHSRLLYRVIGQLVLFLAVGIGIVIPLVNAFGQTGPTSRTNSTVTPGLIYLLDTIIPQLPPGAIVSDDYGKRSTSWFLLSDRPTFSRLASDLRRPMQESQQNETRHQLYLKQLQLEKIYNLSSSSLILPLLTEEKISAVTGVEGTSFLGFSQNPALKEVAWADSVHMFTPIS